MNLCYLRRKRQNDADDDDTEAMIFFCCRASLPRNKRRERERDGWSLVNDIIDEDDTELGCRFPDKNGGGQFHLHLSRMSEAVDFTTVGDKKDAVDRGEAHVLFHLQIRVAMDYCYITS